MGAHCDLRALGEWAQGVPNFLCPLQDVSLFFVMPVRSPVYFLWSSHPVPGLVMELQMLIWQKDFPAGAFLSCGSWRSIPQYLGSAAILSGNVRIEECLTLRSVNPGASLTLPSRIW